MIIFTGTGRSGTGWLAQCFRAHHEYRAREFVAQQWPGMVYDWADARRRIAAMEWLLAGVNRATFRDSCNLYVHFLDALYVLDRHVRIVVCQRDRQAFIESAVLRGWHLYSGCGCAPLRNDPAAAAWARMTAEERCGWQYDFRMAKARERAQGVPPDQVFWCRLEDISQDLSPVEDFVGAGADDVWRHQRYLRGRCVHRAQE